MQMPEIETHIPFADYPPTYEALQARVDAAFLTLSELVVEEGMDEIEVTDDDAATARNLFTNGSLHQKGLTQALTSSGVVVHLKALLSEYDNEVVQSAAQLRRYVTNRLIEDSNDKNPTVRLRCYELLGKISDVGLFTDKTEVTMRHRPTEELEQMLRERLMKTLEGDAVTVSPAPSIYVPGMEAITPPEGEDALAFLDQPTELEEQPQQDA